MHQRSQPFSPALDLHNYSALREQFLGSGSFISDNTHRPPASSPHAPVTRDGPFTTAAAPNTSDDCSIRRACPRNRGSQPSADRIQERSLFFLSRDLRSLSNRAN